jgi:hypothetical protein
MLGGTVGLSANQGPNGSLQTIGSSFVPSVFGNAECACSPTDANSQIHLEIRLTQALPANTTGNAELWAGIGCDSYMTRTSSTQTQCEKLATLDINLFTTGGLTPSNGLIEIPFSGTALTSPIRHVCDMNAASNNLYVFVFQDATMPMGTCTLNLSEQNQGPQAVTATQASGDGAVTLSWQLPPVGTIQPIWFQVLCADANGLPVAGKGGTQRYSTCINNTISRRLLINGGSAPGVTTPDGGMASTFLGPELAREVVPFDVDGGASDLGVDGGTSDMGTPDMGINLGTFTGLDPKFICAETGANGTNPSLRIDGLTNHHTYQFTVLAIDKYGNASPSPVVSATPEPVDDLYRRYREANGSAQGFCFIATAAFGSYEDRYVRVLREFRDRVLLPTSLGRSFVDWYYANSPPAAAYIADHDWARWLARTALWPVIGGAAAWLYLQAWQKALLCTIIFAWLMRKRLRAHWTQLRSQGS